MAAVVGYATVQQASDDLTEQEAALRGAGADRVFVDRVETSSTGPRPQWRACVEGLDPGDSVVVPTLGVLGETERVVVEALADLSRRGVGIRSIAEPAIDTSPQGGALYDIVAVFEGLRAERIRERTLRGLHRARSEGRVGGRPSVMTAERMAEARRLRARGASIAEIARSIGVGSSSVSRALAKHRVGADAPEAEARVFFRDTKPYEAPATLDDLEGPARGTVDLPHSVYWGPERAVDLGTPGGIRKAYQAVLREGTAADQTRLLNREVLRREWNELALPDRVRVLWESRFPELRTRASA